MTGITFSEVVENIQNRFAESPLGRKFDSDDSLDDMKGIEDSSLALCGENRGLTDYETGGEICDMKDNKPDAADRPEDTKLDDNGRPYYENGELLPDNEYVLNGNTYRTDDHGRIVNSEAKPQLSPENPRDLDAQRKAGGEDRKPDDQGGHIVGRDMNGDSGIGNIVPMDSRINQSDYKRMENDIKNELKEGKDVTVKTEMTYTDDSKRPDKIKVTVESDGKKTEYTFDNNLDGSLRNEVPENGKEVVQDKLDRTGGEVSSIKKEYDENGELKETTVYITYKGEDGTNYRTSVVIDNSQGGN